MRAIRFSAALALLVTGIPPLSWAAPGDLDLTFGIGGLVTTEISALPSTIRGLARSSDGRLLAVGESEFERVALARYDSDGVVDASFGLGGIVTLMVTHSSFVGEVGLRSDGRSLLVGSVCGEVVGFFACDAIAVPYAADGSIEQAAWSIGFGEFPFQAVTQGTGVLLQPDGSAVVSFSVDGSSRLVRLNSMLAADQNFGTGGQIATLSSVQRLLAGADDKILGLGNSGSTLVRHHPDGSVDTGFGVNGVASLVGQGRDAALHGDGGIVVAGTVSGSFLLARYDASGVLDPTFGTNGTVITPVGAGNAVAAAVVVQSDGTIIAAGSASNGATTDIALVGYEANGMLDTSFGAGGIVTTPVGLGDASAHALVVVPGGGVVVAGMSGTNGDLVLARYETVVCGNGVVEAGEMCDEGSETGGVSCCSSSCEIRSAGEGCRPSGTCLVEIPCDGVSPLCPVGDSYPDGTSCDDGDACTTGDACAAGACGVPTVCSSCSPVCDPAVGCIAAPRAGCLVPSAPFKAKLTLKNRPEDARDGLTWKWLVGEETSTEDFGDPLSIDDYTLCVYDESDTEAAILLSATAPAGGACRKKPCWKLATSSPRYRDRDRTPDGLDLIVPRAGAVGKAKIIVKGKGENLRLPALPLSLPIRVQLHAGTGTCWEATYSAKQFQTNTPTDFRGRAD